MKKSLITCILMIAIIFINAQLISERIVDIVVEGNYFASQGYIIDKSLLSVGSGTIESDIQRAVKELYKTGIFEQVEIYKRASESGDIIVISVIEQNRISKIIMKGNKKLKEKDLFEKISINEGDYASLANFHKIKNELISHYNNEGYLNAEVSVESDENDDNRVNILIKIVENQKIFIKHIEIYGNLKITDNKIKGKMATKEKAFLKDGLFKEEDFKEDKKIILSLIKENGFPDAVIDSVIKEFSYDNKSMFINIYVTQGTEYIIGDITINGNNEVKTEILQHYIKARKGDVFNQSIFDNMLAGMYEYYMNKGYIYVSILPEDIREDEYISFKINITENNQAIIRDIIITGNEKTEDAIVRREILTLPGDVFKRNELVLSHSNLFRSGFYEDVQINPIPIPETDKVDIEFRVVEKTTGEFNIGMQYNQVDNFSGNIKIGINNILGKGLSSNIMLEKGFNVFNINLGFTEPYLMGYPIVAGADGYYQTRNYTYYNDRRKGGKIRTGYILSKKLNTKVYLSYKLEEVYLYNNSLVDSNIFDPWILSQLNNAQWLSELSPSIVRDSRNHYFFPEAGQLMGIYFNFAGGPFGGQIDYYKMTMDFRHYQKLFWKLTLMSRFAGGFVDGYSSPETVPISERFSLGGVGFWGLRGYYDRAIGPYSDNYCIGGRGSMLINMELRLKLNEQAYLLMFYDVGNAWENMTTAWSDKFAPLYHATGIGVRMEIPMMGILGIDLGYGFTDTDFAGGGKWEPHFQIGTSF